MARADFYTPELARALGLGSPIWYDWTFRALCSSHNREVYQAWRGGYQAAVDQLVDLAKRELLDRVTAMKALCGRTPEQFFQDQAARRPQASPRLTMEQAEQMLYDAWWEKPSRYPRTPSLTAKTD